MTVDKLIILIVDDQRVVSDALKMILEFDGYEVQTAQSGREAIAIFEMGKFDLIFTDFEMPEMNGHELASIIKARDSKQPIILTLSGGEGWETYGRTRWMEFSTI